jgi:hypothetical protein
MNKITRKWNAYYLCKFVLGNKSLFAFWMHHFIICLNQSSSSSFSRQFREDLKIWNSDSHDVYRWELLVRERGGLFPFCFRQRLSGRNQIKSNLCKIYCLFAHASLHGYGIGNVAIVCDLQYQDDETDPDGETRQSLSRTQEPTMWRWKSSSL